MSQVDDNPDIEKNENNMTRNSESNDSFEMPSSRRSGSTDFIQTPTTREEDKIPRIHWTELPPEIRRNIICDPDGKLWKIKPTTVCNACEHCNDTCELDNCITCMKKRENIVKGKTFTICEMRRNRNLLHCWVVVGNDIYDASKYLQKHPGGVTSIVRYAGGIDCSEHLYFHSSRGKNKWKEFYIGKLVYCEGGKDDPNSPPPSSFGTGSCSVS